MIPIVWQYGIPVKASSSDIDETIKLHEKRVFQHGLAAGLYLWH